MFLVLKVNTAVSYLNAGSSGSRAEANILKHVRKEWPELRDRLSVSPDDSTDASSPTRNNSPARAMDDHMTGSILVTEDQSRDRLMPDEILVVPSTKKLKESLILMAKKKNSPKLVDGKFISKPYT